MLVLTLKLGEIVHIGDDVQIVYKGDAKVEGEISVGFEAPRSVNIERDSLRKRKKSANPDLPKEMRKNARRKMLAKNLLKNPRKTNK